MMNFNDMYRINGGNATVASMNGIEMEGTDMKEVTMQSYHQVLKQCLVVIDAVIPVLEKATTRDTLDKVKALSKVGHQLIDKNVANDLMRQAGLMGLQI